MKPGFTEIIKLGTQFMCFLGVLILLVSCDSSIPTSSPSIIPSLAATSSPLVSIAPAATPESKPAVIYEAELAVMSGGAAIATDHVDFTGTAFVAGYVDG